MESTTPHLFEKPAAESALGAEGNYEAKPCTIGIAQVFDMTEGRIGADYNPGAQELGHFLQREVDAR